jgi:hypothetical protein
LHGGLQLPHAAPSPWRRDCGEVAAAITNTNDAIVGRREPKRNTAAGNPKVASGRADRSRRVMLTQSINFGCRQDDVVAFSCKGRGFASRVVRGAWPRRRRTWWIT